MNNTAMQRLETIEKLLARDQQIKRDQEALNQDINKFIQDEVGLKGPATLLDILKRTLETSFEQSRIIAP